MILSSLKPPLSFPSVSGAICTFNSQYAGLPLKAHEVAVVATQTGTGTPSPSNPRSISGYSVINISHSDADTSNPTVYTIQIGSTIYGGTYDAITGVLTVTDKIIDLGNLSWSASGANFVSPYFNLTDTNIKPPASNADTLDGMCEVLNLTSYNGLADKSIALSSGKNLFARNSDYTDANDFKNSVTGYYLKYPLATTTTIQLSPAQILSLLGENNVWADTGDTTLQYIKLG